tara:strand:+ start:233 stop:472 length:240 start_codon:yes stop_codon:yes gene_type:complete
LSTCHPISDSKTCTDPTYGIKEREGQRENKGERTSQKQKENISVTEDTLPIHYRSIQMETGRENISQTQNLRDVGRMGV